MAKIKTEVTERIDSYCLDAYDFEGTIADVVARLCNIEKEVSQLGYRNIYIDTNGYNSYFDLKGTRDLTPAEMERNRKKRAAERKKQKKMKEKVIEREKREFERLKEKYG